MCNVKPYKDCTSEEKQARKSFSCALCTNCFLHKQEGGCNLTIYNVCLNSYTKGFVKGIKHHRKVVKNKNKKL